MIVFYILTFVFAILAITELHRTCLCFHWAVADTTNSIERTTPMKLWIDDIRPAPEGYRWAKTVNSAIRFLETHEALYRNGDIPEPITLISIDHDAGDYARFGGDYIELLDWLEETGRNYPIRIHSQSPVGIANMRRIIERNGWKEVF